QGSLHRSAGNGEDGVAPVGSAGESRASARSRSGERGAPRRSLVRRPGTSAPGLSHRLRGEVRLRLVDEVDEFAGAVHGRACRSGAGFFGGRHLVIGGGHAPAPPLSGSRVLIFGDLGGPVRTLRRAATPRSQ